MLGFRFKLVSFHSLFSLVSDEIGAFSYLLVLQVTVYIDLYWLHVVQTIYSRTENPFETKTR